MPIIDLADDDEEEWQAGRSATFVENETIRDVSGIELYVSDLTLAPNETYTLLAIVYPENAANKILNIILSHIKKDETN